jgi:hypothetical protein
LFRIGRDKQLPAWVKQFKLRGLLKIVISIVQNRIKIIFGFHLTNFRRMKNMLKRESWGVVGIFCVILCMVVFCSVFYVYGQNVGSKTLASQTTEKQNQTTPADTSKDVTKNENKNNNPQNNPNAETDIESIAAVVEGVGKVNVYRIGINIVAVPDVLVSHFSGGDGAETRANVKADSEDNGNGNIANIAAGGQRGMVFVVGVMADSPAAKAGVERGDVIVKFGGKEITSPDDLIKQVNIVKDTEQVLVFIRNGKKSEVKITPEKVEGSELGLRGVAPFESDFRMLPYRHFKLGDRKELMSEIEEMFNQLRDGSGVDLFFSFPDGNNSFLPNLNLPKIPLPKLPLPKLSNPQNIHSGKAKALTITTQTDPNGKTKIKVNKSTTSNGKTEENVWEAENIDDLPEEIRNEVKQFIQIK